VKVNSGQQTLLVVFLLRLAQVESFAAPCAVDVRKIWGCFAGLNALCSLKSVTERACASHIRWRGTPVLIGLDAQSATFSLPTGFALRA